MTPEPIVTTTRYEVSCLPDDHEARKHFTIPVTRTRSGSWVVGSDHEWYGFNCEFRERPVEMDQETAIRIAKTCAPAMVIQGRTVADVLARGGGQ